MMLQTLWKAMITLKMTCNNMSTLIVPEIGDSTQRKYLRKIHIVVSEGKYKKKKCCLYCPFEDIKDATMVFKLHRHLQSLHQRELRVSNLRRINLEIEEIEESKEIATTERGETDLRKLHKEKDQTYRLITYGSQYKCNIAVFKKCMETK